MTLIQANKKAPSENEGAFDNLQYGPLIFQKIVLPELAP